MKNDQEKFKDEPDARKTTLLEVGDKIAAIWFNDPNYYIGRLEIADGELGLPLGDSIWGNINDAYHVVLLEKRYHRNIGCIVILKTFDIGIF